MNVRTNRALSLRSFLKHTMMCVHLSTSSAYSKRDTNPSLEPSGRRYEGTCMYNLCCQSTVSQETSVFSVSRSRNVRRKDECCSAASSNSFSVTILLWLRCIFRDCMPNLFYQTWGEKKNFSNHF